MDRVKNVKVRENTRFIICIDDNFDNLYLRDLNKQLSNIESYNVLQENFNSVVQLVKAIEKKSELKTKEDKHKGLKIVK